MSKQTISNIISAPGFRGNDSLRPLNYKHSYTREELIEYNKCLNDKYYFIKNYVKLIDSGDLVTMDLYDYQDRLLKTIDDNRFTICKASRQVGKTMAVTAYMAWHLLFNDNFSIAVASNKDKSAKSVIYRLQIIIEELPIFLQQGIRKWDAHSIYFENRSKIITSATTKDAFRGEPVDMLYLDEFAFVEQNIADEFFKSVYPTVERNKDSKMIITSTPNKMNHFYSMWSKAIEGKGKFTPVEVKWNDVPGRDEAYKQETIDTVGLDLWEQEYECLFKGGINSLVSSTALNSLRISDPIQIIDDVKIFKNPVPGNKYIITVDTARGTGGDYSAFTIIDITQYPFEVVCTYRNNQIPSLLYPNVIYRMGMTYNMAMLLIELNDIGEEVANILFHDLEYENILTTTQKQRTGQILGYGNYLGMKTTVQTKRIGCQNLKVLIESNKLEVVDAKILEELVNFVPKGKSFEAAIGSTDDLVMCLVIFSWAATQPFFKELINKDIRDLFKTQAEKFDEEVLSFFHDDGAIITSDSYDYLW